MELREFAEQVLFATTLEDKLRCPEVITDECPGPARPAPTSPGRPADLQFKPQGTARGEFPGTAALEKPGERGRLLHFFANHELLATELMALVLLRFPEAPSAFRRGVLQTLKDEQEHTRWYVERMRACGLQFGELPVSGYFWRAVSGMESPMDYVAGLSLTFEQANLDFARHFARGFATVGDEATAGLLEQIYKDEIAHVAYGLKWFRRWKNPTESDWEAFCRQLKFPLSPTRAKGFTLNVEGRQAAGLTADFIDELNVHAQSKGRTPVVHLFNPLAEGYVALGRAFTPVKHQAQLARDLANLPQFLARQDDIVLVPKRPATRFLSGLKQAGFSLPEFVEVGDSPAGHPRDLSELAQRKLGGLRPWAWSPDSLEQLRPLFPSVSGQIRPMEECFNARVAELYGKSWSAGFLRKALEGMEESWLCPLEMVGQSVKSVAEARAAVQDIRARGHHRVVLKESLGLAGANALRLWEPDWLPAQIRWLENVLERGGEVVVEPWLEREFDFSAQLEMGPTGLKWIGWTGLVNDRKGQFRANWAASHFDRRPPEPLLKLISEPRDFPRRWPEFSAGLFQKLELELRARKFLGPLGVDALVYRESGGQCRVKPVVEINPRFTMGRLTLELMHHACPGRLGVFRLTNARDLGEAGVSTLAAWAESQRAKYPLELEGEPVPRLRSGWVALNDPEVAQVCLASFQVVRPPDQERFISAWE